MTAQPESCQTNWKNFSSLVAQPVKVDNVSGGHSITAGELELQSEDVAKPTKHF